MSTTAGADVADGLTRLLGPGGVLAGADADGHRVDVRGLYRAPDDVVVARPDSTGDVAAVVDWCRANGLAVVTQGGNSGMSGGATPGADRPSVILSLARLNRIEPIEPHQWAVTAEAGATIQAVQEAAAASGRLFAPDWGARGTATVGGAIATDAGGNNVLRYGNMRAQVLGVEAVLADGRVWNGMRALRKDSSGYDLKQLLIGSEGTLGIVTRAVLTLHPATPHARSALATLSGLDSLMSLFALARHRAPDAITAFELIPEVGLDRVCSTYGIPRPVPPGAEFHVLLKLAATTPVDEMLGRLLTEADDEGLITDAVLAGTADQEERLWRIRDELPPSRLYAHHGMGIKMDTAVPIESMVRFHTEVRHLAAEVVPGALVYGFGHVGDGNLHLYVLPVDDDGLESFRRARPELQRRIDEIVFAIGGTLSGEHGIGQELLDRIGGQKPDLEWELMRTIKAALDPDGLLNPGKLFPVG